jgi:hypothetical protein
MENNKQSITKILTELKALKLSTSGVEGKLGFSNGLIGKASKGLTTISDEKFAALESFYEEQTAGETKYESEAKVLDMNDTGNASFDTLLKEFHGLIEGAPKSDEIKAKLIALRERAVSTKTKEKTINWNQMKAITERCDNYIAGVYGKSYSK